MGDRVIHLELPFNMTTDELELDPAAENCEGVREQLKDLAEFFSPTEVIHTLTSAVALYNHLNGGVNYVAMYGERIDFARCLYTARIWMRG